MQPYTDARTGAQLMVIIKISIALCVTQNILLTGIGDNLTISKEDNNQRLQFYEIN